MVQTWTAGQRKADLEMKRVEVGAKRLRYYPSTDFLLMRLEEIGEI